MPGCEWLWSQREGKHSRGKPACSCHLPVPKLCSPGGWGALETAGTGRQGGWAELSGVSQAGEPNYQKPKEIDASLASGCALPCKGSLSRTSRGLKDGRFKRMELGPIK